MQAALEQLKKDAEDEELVETVSCDGNTKADDAHIHT